MLDPATWAQHTLRVTAGHGIRVEHGCGAGRTLKVEHKEAGFTAYCFRCDDRGFIPHPQPSLSERLASLAKRTIVEQAACASLDLPRPAEYDPQLWPMRARVWLYKAGLSNDDIVSLGFYYTSSMARVVMPILEDGRVVYWQARGFDKGAKYLNPLVPKPLARYGSGPVLVLTEDMLSAVKVARVTSAWALMGTSVTDAAITQISSPGKPVAVMLDPDSAGAKGRAKVRKYLGAAGINATVLRPHKDPKLLSSQEIRSYLTRAGFVLP